MHQSSFHIMTRFKDLVEKTFPQEKVTILDVGSYGVNGTYKEIFSNPAKFIYTGLDVNPGPNVDYVPKDPYKWTDLQDESFDVIISGQAFEHIEFPWLIIEEISRVLKINGLACIVAPSRGPEHKYPVDCWRYYPDGFRALAKWANLQVLDAKATWGKSGFTDGSDQWGDAFCIMFKQEKTTTREKRQNTPPKALLRKNQNNPLNIAKQDSYYGFVRTDVIAALTRHNIPAGRVLEIGCAGGGTGKQIRGKFPVDYYVGVELSEKAAAIAQKHLHRVIVANIEETDLKTEYGLKPEEFDLVLALDVLEHLYNPWDVLSELSTFVKPGGHVVASLPNIQNISIVQDLVSGKWSYQDAGILDATHLRFFTLDESQKMFTGAGLILKHIEHIFNPQVDIDKLKDTDNRYHHKNFTLDHLTRSEIRDLFTYQHIIIAQKPVGIQTLTKTPSDHHPADGENHCNAFFKEQTVKGLTSIIILTYNELTVTKECVKSLRRCTPEPHEIIFVDNGSTDGTVQWLKSQIRENKNFRLIENHQNLGFAKGCNQGIEASRGEYIVLLNNDVVVSKDWLAGLLECHHHAPDAGIIGPMTNNISGPQKIDDDSYRSVEHLEQFAETFRKKYRHRRISFRRIVGFCMLFKRSLVETIGLLDESFGTGNFEDDDFCLRAALAGHKNYMAGDVFIHHYGSRSFIGNKINYGASISGNKQIMNKKWALSMASPEGKKLAILRATELAHVFNAKGNLDQAVETLVNCIKYAPDEPIIYFELTRLFIEVKKYPEARDVVASMPAKAQSMIKGLEYAAYTKEGLGSDDEAAVLADKILWLDKNYAAAINLLGVLSFKKGDKEKAKNFFEQAILADPGYGEAHTNLGVLHWGMEHTQEAFDYLKKGFVLSPSVPDASSLYYSVVSALDKFSEAEADFAEACRLDPHNRNLAYLHIDILIQQGKYDSALLTIQDALVTFGLDDGALNAALAVRDKIGPMTIGKPGQKGTLSLCMIVKNEEKYLAKCLKSVRDVVDEMIIVDTGSNDKTKDVARVFGAKVYEFPWTGDFSAARNESLSHAEGEWVLILDADEVISSLDHKELKNLIQKRTSKPIAYSIVTRNYINNMSVIGWTPNKGEYPEEAGAGWVPSPKVRLAPRRKDVFFTNPVHELLENSLKAQKIPVAACKILVHHYGKLDVGKDAQKGEDYYLLGKIKYENDPANVKYIFELAKQAHLLKKYDETVELWQKLLSLIEDKPESSDYKLIKQISVGDPIAEIYTQLAAALLLLDRYDEALHAATKAMLTSERLKEYVYIYAYCEVIAGSVEKASIFLKKVLDETPDYLPALLVQCIASALEDNKEMTKSLMLMLRRKNPNVNIQFNKTARQLHTNGRTDQALRLLTAMTENKIANKETAQLLETFQKETPSSDGC